MQDDGRDARHRRRRCLERLAAVRLARGRGQDDFEGGALPVPRALRVRRAPVQLYEVTHYREAEPEPAVSPRRGRVRLPEAVEDVREEVRRDSLPRVSDRDLDSRTRARETNLYEPAARRELDRVGE